MRIVLVIISLLLAVLAVFLFTDKPKQTALKPPVKTRIKQPAPTPTTTVTKPKRKARPEADIDAATPPPIVDAGLIVDADVDESGQYSLSLGTHRVKLRGENDIFLKAEVILKTPSAKVRENARRLKSKLVGMYFFLVSRRAEEGVRSEGGIERIESDLLNRYANTIRSGKLESVELKNHEIQEGPEED